MRFSSESLTWADGEEDAFCLTECQTDMTAVASEATKEIFNLEEAEPRDRALLPCLGPESSQAWSLLYLLEISVPFIICLNICSI